MATNPTSTNKNHFLSFFSKIGHAIQDVLKFGKKLGDKVITIIQEEEELTPEFLTELAAFVSAGGALISAGSIAVGAKGLNPLQDEQTFTALENFVKVGETFIPTVEKALAILEGKNPTPVSATTTTEETETPVVVETSTGAEVVSTEPVVETVKFTPPAAS
jgi:hypothetical protein